MDKMGVKLSFVLFSMFLFQQESQGTTADAPEMTFDITKYGAVPTETFDVTKYGAVADGKTDFSPALMKAWGEACNGTAPATVLIPKGDYVLGEVLLEGPCTAATIGLTIDGNLKTHGDPQKFKNGGWFNIQRLSNVIIEGNGVLDGDGESAWMKNTCHKDPMCKNLPMNMRLNFLNNSEIRDITSLDSKNFHINLLECNNVVIDNVNITAPAGSPNTNGIHIGRSSGINITDTVIKTGGDCISFGDATTKVLVQGVSCGPGHGLSIGSLGKYKNEKPVTGIIVRDCTMSNTDNGVRIKTWPASAAPNSASDIHFENIAMDNVSNPIIIDQEYCPWNQCNKKIPSTVKISDVSFRNITGTSSTALAVTLICSATNPCTNVQISNVDLKYSGPQGPATSICKNIQPNLSGKLSPQLCVGVASATPGAKADDGAQPSKPGAKANPSAKSAKHGAKAEPGAKSAKPGAKAEPRGEEDD